MKLSVVTITYNNFSELKSTLDSIANVEGIESVVINGGNCQRTIDLLKSHNGIVISEPDEGIADAFNKGVRNSSGDAIIFLNSGDLLIDANYFPNALRFIEEDKSINFVHSDIFYNDPIAGKIPLSFRNISLGRGMPYFHQSLIVTREVFEKIGSFSKEYNIAMDFDFVVRMTSYGFKGRYIEGETILMDGNGVSNNKELLGILECGKSLFKHKQINFRNILGYVTRLIFFLARRSLPSVALAKLKALKYRK